MDSAALTPDTPVGDRLSVRAANALWRILGTIDSVTPAQIAEVSYRDLQRQPHVGPKTIREVRALLQGVGLDLRELPDGRPDLVPPDAWTVAAMALRGAGVLVTLESAGALLRVPYSAEAAKALHVGATVRLVLEVPRG